MEDQILTAIRAGWGGGGERTFLGSNALWADKNKIYFSVGRK